MWDGGESEPISSGAAATAGLSCQRRSYSGEHESRLLVARRIRVDSTRDSLGSKCIIAKFE